LFGALTIRAFAQEPDQLLSNPLAELFGIAPTIGEPKLSPDGSQMIFLQQNAQGVTVLQNLNLSDGSVTTLLAGSEDGYDIYWCAFANAERIMCDLRRGIPGFDPEYQYYYLMNTDGSDLDKLRRGTGCTTADPVRGTYPIDWLPEDPEHILFICGGNVSRLNIDSRRVTAEVGAGESGSAKRLFSDDRGLGNIYSGRIGNNDHWYFRDAVKSDWVEFDVTNPLEFEDPFRPVGYGENTDSVFNIAWNTDSNTWALYTRSLSGDFANTLVVKHPDVDIELVDTMGPYDRVVSVPYIDGRTRRYILDARVREVHDFVTGQLPDVDVEILDESWDQNVYLARAKTDLTAGELLVINMGQETIQTIGSEYAHLAPYVMADSKLVEITGADGSKITGQLSLPSGTVGRVPAVIIPRAQASREAVADPHYLVQFLAASGYAVLRLNNRGPEEHGGWLPQRSVVGWNRTADDINEAAKFLVDTGIAEADAICGIGKDYGAYAALTTALKYPELMQCIVSISGIADPRGSAGANMVAGGSALSGDLLDEASPVKRAADLEPAILLFHARNNPTVRMANNAVSLTNALESAGKQVQFIQYLYDDHDIHRGPYRTDMLTRISDFLAEHIGTATLADIDVDTGG
jgi:esterase/lipase superfamily enzyme